MAGKSRAFFDIVNLIRLNVITIDDLEDYSEELQEAVKEIIAR